MLLFSTTTSHMTISMEWPRMNGLWSDLTLLFTAKGRIRGLLRSQMTWLIAMVDSKSMICLTIRKFFLLVSCTKLITLVIADKAMMNVLCFILHTMLALTLQCYFLLILSVMLKFPMKNLYHKVGRKHKVEHLLTVGFIKTQNKEWHALTSQDKTECPWLFKDCDRK